MPKDKKDWCGQAGDDWFSRFCSWLIPDYIKIDGRKVYIGFCCMDHDHDNEANGANKAGDEKFKKCIRIQLKNAGASKRQVLWHSNKYFIGVRIGNPFYKSSGEVASDIKKEIARKLRALRGR